MIEGAIEDVTSTPAEAVCEELVVSALILPQPSVKPTSCRITRCRHQDHAQRDVGGMTLLKFGKMVSSLIQELPVRVLPGAHGSWQNAGGRFILLYAEDGVTSTANAES